MGVRRLCYKTEVWSVWQHAEKWTTHTHTQRHTMVMSIIFSLQSFAFVYMCVLDSFILKSLLCLFCLDWTEFWFNSAYYKTLFSLILYLAHFSSQPGFLSRLTSTDINIWVFLFFSFFLGLYPKIGLIWAIVVFGASFSIPAYQSSDNNWKQNYEEGKVKDC